MIERMRAWWRVRTPRERVLLQAAAVLALVVAAPLTAVQQAYDFRRTAGVDLASARAVEDMVDRLAEEGAGNPSPIVGDGTVQSAVVIAAQEQGLAVARFAPSGPDRIRLAFEASDSRAIMRWLDRMARAGFEVSSARIVRVGEGDLVTAEFDVAAAS
jgi:type II secretory pathway component PulM